MITSEALRALVDYNEWANARLLAAAAALSDEALHRPLRGAGHGSIFGQLRHIVATQATWLAGFTGRADSPDAAWALVQASGRFDFDTREGLWKAFETAQADLRDFAAGVTTEALARPFLPERLGPLPLGAAVAHLLLHAQHHRGETAALLTDLGHSPGDLDFLYFCFERR